MKSIKHFSFLSTLGFLCLITAFCSFSLGCNDRSSKHDIPEDIFPSGSPGLSDTNAETDQIKALTEEVVANRTETDSTEVTTTPDPQIPPPAVSQAPESIPPEAEPSPLESATPTTQIDSSGPFRRVIPEITWPIGIEQSSGGVLWIADRVGVWRISATGEQTQVLTPQAYEAEHKAPLPFITSVGAAADDSLWVGFDAGQLMHYESAQWSLKSKQRETIKSVVNDIVRFGDDVVVASIGLFTWERNFQRLLANPTFRRERISSLGVSPSGKLYSGGRKALYVSDSNAEETWSTVWRTPPKDFSIHTLKIRNDGSFLLGTNDGLVSVTNGGITSNRALHGIQVNDIALEADNKGIWVASQSDGLFYFNGAKWFHASATEGIPQRTTVVFLDKSERLWIGSPKLGLFRAPVYASSKWISKHPLASKKIASAKEFRNACEASAEILSGVQVSGTLSSTRWRGKEHVFLNGQLICPKGVGYFSPKAGSAILEGNQIVTSSNGKVRTEKLPDDLKPETVTKIFFDSKERLWVGTQDAGLLIYSDGLNQHFREDAKLLNNPITSILEDTKGNIWVGTTPPYDPAAKGYSLPALHLYNEQGWFHFDTTHGLPFPGVLSLSLTKAGSILLGTRKGVSLIDRKGHITNYGEKHGLTSFFAHSARMDQKGRVWLAHQLYGDGVLWFSKNYVHRINKTHGLFEDRIIDIGFDANRSVWLFSSDGKVAVYPTTFFDEKKITSKMQSSLVKSRKMFGK